MHQPAFVCSGRHQGTLSDHAVVRVVELTFVCQLAAARRRHLPVADRVQESWDPLSPSLQRNPVPRNGCVRPGLRVGFSSLSMSTPGCRADCRREVPMRYPLLQVSGQTIRIAVMACVMSHSRPVAGYRVARVTATASMYKTLCQSYSVR